MFSFFATIAFVQKEAKKLKKKMRQIIQINDHTLSGLITKQFARQIAWTAGFFVNLDEKENVENIMECISAVQYSVTRSLTFDGLGALQ